MKGDALADASELCGHNCVDKGVNDGDRPPFEGEILPVKVDRFTSACQNLVHASRSKIGLLKENCRRFFCSSLETISSPRKKPGWMCSGG